MRIRDVIEWARAGDATILAQLEEGMTRDALAARLLRDDPALGVQCSPAKLRRHLFSGLPPECGGRKVIAQARPH